MPDTALDLELGSSGLITLDGTVHDERLRQLSSPQRRHRTYREMADNDPVVAAVLFVVDMLIRQVDWTVEPFDPNNAADAEAAEFVQSCFEDLNRPFKDVVSEALSFLTYGWSWHETVFKRRLGPAPNEVLVVDATNRPDVLASLGDEVPPSKYTDGAIGWHKFAGRAPETLSRWVFDAHGEVLAFVQQAPPYYRETVIPLAKSLHFRTSALRNNPEGRALALDTPVPTPEGWRVMADLREGDPLFDETGRVRYVTGVRDWADRPVYRLTFSDGSTIVADAEHQWATTTLSDRLDRRGPSVRSTAEIAATVKTTQGTSNHAIPWAAPLRYAPQYLEVEPWTLGLWLGDGTSLSSNIACHVDDAEETAALLAERGYPATVSVNGGSENGRTLYVRGDLQRRLRALGVLGNKHVPEHYLRGSVEQRVELLRGLMDSDGTVDADGRCEFTNTNRALVDATAELVRSLGMGTRVSLRKRATSDRSEAWCVKFTPSRWVPFNLSRKAARCSDAPRAREQHYIVSAEVVERQATRCIEVDAPSHLFLAGTSMVPTHNSILRSAYRPWYFKKVIEEIQAVGVERDLAGLPVLRVPKGVLAATPTSENAALRTQMERMVRNIRRGAQEGVLLPSSPVGADGKSTNEYSLELLTSGGRRQFDTKGLLEYYDQRIALMALADFVLMGHEKVGSFALADSKTNVFTMATGAWVDVIGDQFNDRAIPQLLRINGRDDSRPPRLVHSDIETIDLDQLGRFISNLASAGAPLFPNEELTQALLDQAKLPYGQVEEL